MSQRRGRDARTAISWLGYHALCEANRPAYIQYAERRITDRAEAGRCVDAVLSALKDRWLTVLGSRCPAAHIWTDLRIEAERRTPRAGSRAERLHAILRPAQADIVILHHDLGLPVERAAHLMGMTNPIAHALLRGAQRDLGTPFEG
ncbi:hypothetical protein [Streptomyces niveus]|uniref:hypothetical protein n=1 Tax=Streptomyces niveus TaxID=193462 RepID=UPI00084C9491|nr:hypothetical protein [Streptomyces niveus]